MSVFYEIAYAAYLEIRPIPILRKSAKFSLI